MAPTEHTLDASDCRVAPGVVARRIRRKSLPASPASPATINPKTADVLLSAKASATAVGLSLPAFWCAVRNGRFPNPVYPAPRAPRWFHGELLAALETTRQNPSDAKAARRAARLAAG